MGYDTIFKGKLKFTKVLDSIELAYLNSILDEDCREHPEWQDEIQNIGCDPDCFTYIDLVLLDDFSGVKWNDKTEKTYDLVEKVQLVINLMNNKFYNDFGLIGQLSAQGEDFDDRWILECDGKSVNRKEVTITGRKIQCPHCEEYFILEDDSYEQKL